MKKHQLFGLLAGVLVVCFLNEGKAQVDQTKMVTSLKKAEQQLTQMFRKEDRKYQDHNMKGYIHIGQGREAVGMYIPGYGVVLKVPHVSLRLRSRTVRRNRKNGSLYINLGNRNRMQLSDSRHNNRDQVYYLRTGLKDAYQYQIVDRDSLIKARKATMQAMMKKFLSGASNLMALLPANEKIELIYDYKSRMHNFYYPSGRSKSKIKMPDQVTASIDKGTWQRNKNKTSITEKNIVQPEANLQVLSGIISGLYKRSVSSSFYGYNRVKYNKLGKFGVLYDLRLYARVSADAEENYICIEDGKVVDSDSLRARKSGNYAGIKAERQKANSEAYQKFEQEVKQYLVEYGRLLKDFDSAKTLVLHVSLPNHWYTSDDKTVPQNVLVSVKGDVLQKVKAGKLTADNAKGQVTLVKY